MPAPQKVTLVEIEGRDRRAGGAWRSWAMLVFLLTSQRQLFKRKLTLRTYMDDASGMTEGTPVRLNGIPIGNLEEHPALRLDEPAARGGVRCWRYGANIRRTFRSIPSP